MAGDAELGRLIELSNDLCCVLTQQGVFEWVNPASERILGWRPEEIIGRHAYELIHPDDAARSRELGHGEVANFENRYQHKDGSWRRLLWSATLADGRWYGIAKDVTSHTEPSGREDRLYRSIVEQTTQGIWALDADDRTLFVNPYMAEMLGYRQEEMLGRALYDFFDDDTAVAGARERGARRRTGVSELHEVRFRRKDGTVVFAVIQGSPLFDENGRYDGRVGMVTDVSDRRRAQDQLALLAAVVESSSDAVIACSLDGAVQSWNAAAERLFGYTAAEMAGRPLSEILPTGDESLLAMIDSAVGRELEGQLEIDTVAQDGTSIPVELTAFPVETPDGRTTGIAVTMRDVRDRREAERRIRENQRALGDIEKLGRLGTWEFLLDTGEAVWSEEAYRIHGVERADFTPTSESVLSIVHPDDVEHMRGASQKAMENFASLDVRYRIIRPSGEVRHVQLRAEPSLEAGDRVGRLVGTIQDVTQLAAAEETARAARAELRRQALHDALTGLPNRLLFLDRLNVALARSERAGGGVAVMIVGLDRFGLVNEELGHSFGDQVLAAVATRLVGVMRGGDTVGRLSGDEFAIVCENVQPAEQVVDTLAGRAVDAFGEPFQVGGRDVFLTASAGVAWTEDDESADGLIRRATAALSSAKERERGSFVIASATGRPHAGYGRLAIRNALRDALEDEQLRVVYQPIVRLNDARPHAVEALLRWDHPGLGPVSPLEFVPVAEDTGLIIPIGEWVLNEACEDIAEMHPDLSVSVNLSPRQLVHHDLVPSVRAAVERAGIAPQRLILELTESILVDESMAVGRTLAELKAIGVRLALDDFGTGYSALGYLKRFPMDLVKVDRSFIHGLGVDEGDSAIVGAVLGMARALGLEVVAEGVENEQQLACLTDLGAEYGQGFLFARPCPREQLEAVMAGRRPAA